MSEIQIFAIDKRQDGERERITDLYWFEENGVHYFDDGRSITGDWEFEILIDGVVVFGAKR